MSRQSVLLAGISDVITVAAKVFKEKGQPVLVAKNLEELSQVFATEIAISVMLLELQLEDVNGFSILENVRKGMFKWYRDLPIVIIAPGSSKQLYEKAKSLKISGWLSKPLNHSTLNMIYEKFLLASDDSSSSIKIVDNVRYIFKKELTEFIEDENHKKIKCFSSDISSSELKLVSFESLTVDSVVRFLLQEIIPLRVKWSKNIKPQVYYSNLRSSGEVNLVAKAYEAGLLSSLEPLKTPEKSRDELAKKYNIKIDGIREILSRLHSRDNSLLQKVGLDKDAVPFDTYPIRYEEKSIIIALSAELSPLELSKGSDTMLQQKMQIFGVYNQARSPKWIKIWPLGEVSTPSKSEAKEETNLGENEFEVKVS
ncbi:MAG: response regulator [Oligoflexales bacterium]|nr:response regulator [Oligoflexales bacterium]